MQISPSATEKYCNQIKKFLGVDKIDLITQDKQLWLSAQTERTSVQMLLGACDDNITASLPLDTFVPALKRKNPLTISQFSDKIILRDKGYKATLATVEHMYLPWTISEDCQKIPGKFIGALSAANIDENQVIMVRPLNGKTVCLCANYEKSVIVEWHKDEGISFNIPASYLGMLSSFPDECKLSLTSSSVFVYDESRKFMLPMWAAVPRQTAEDIITLKNRNKKFVTFDVKEWKEALGVAYSVYDPQFGSAIVLVKQGKIRITCTSSRGTIAAELNAQGSCIGEVPVDLQILRTVPLVGNSNNLYLHEQDGQFISLALEGKTEHFTSSCMVTAKLKEEVR